MDKKDHKNMFKNMEKMDGIKDGLTPEESLKLIKIDFYIREFFAFLVSIL